MKWIVVLLLTLLVTNQTFSQKTNSVGMQMVDIPAGRFYMGSEGEGETIDENPVHRVSIKSFKIAAT